MNQRTGAPEAATHPVTAEIRFGLTEQNLTVDLAGALFVLPDGTLQDILGEDGVVSDSIYANLLIETAAKGNQELADAWNEYCGAYTQLSARLSAHRGHGLDGDAEPEVHFDFPSLVAWARLARPSVVQQAKECGASV